MAKRNYEIHFIIEDEYNFRVFNTHAERKAFWDGISSAAIRMEEEHGGIGISDFIWPMAYSQKALEEKTGEPVE